MFYFLLKQMKQSESNMTKQFLSVSYEDRELAKRLGARWDPSVRKWYCTKGSALAKVFAWRAAPKAQAYNTQAHKTRATAAMPIGMAQNQNFELPLMAG